MDDATNDKTSFDADDLASLGNKLASLDLTDPERAALAALIDGDDVSGFARYGKRKTDMLGIRAEGLRMPVVGLRRGQSGDPGVHNPAVQPGKF